MAAQCLGARKKQKPSVGVEAQKGKKHPRVSESCPGKVPVTGAACSGQWRSRSTQGPFVHVNQAH